MKVAIVGAGGYAGSELTSLARAHPSFTEVHAMRGRADVPAQGDIAPLDLARFSQVDLVFLCTPHGAAAPLAKAALDAGAKVVDLSADFRLKDAADELSDTAVYGLTEHARDEVTTAKLVANPGCYPTAVLLPLLPLLEAGFIAEDTPIVADCKSGVSGAGIGATEVTHYGNVHENFRAYGVGTHRHTAEIHQTADTDRIVFVPHLLPCFRGLLATLYITPRPSLDASVARRILSEAYEQEALVETLTDGTPCLRDVQNRNHCAIGAADAYGQVVVVSALDNLRKGAAAQAMQNANLMLGLEEGLGLA